MRRKHLALGLVIPLVIAFCSFTITFRNTAQNKALQSDDTLARGFAAPPKASRPQVFWDWMGGLISREGITKDLEALAAQGISGVLVMQMPDQATDGVAVTFGDYKGKVKCLSDEWFNLVNFAIGECDRLGLSFSIFISPGWSHAGGPWVTPEFGLKKLQATELTVTGPAKVDKLLPPPPKLIGIKAEYVKPEDPAYYKDFAVVAIPDDTLIAARDIIDISKNFNAESRLKWNAPKGKWKIVRLGIASENGQNHPAPPEGTGLESDRMNPKAVQIVFDGMVGRILREAKAKGYRSFKAFETDSYEGGYQDITDDFREQFKRRRGYDCLTWLPAWTNEKLVINNADLTARFRLDMQQTITELHTERFYSELRRLADVNGLTWMTEPYWGMPQDWRTTGSKSTMPGCEFWVAPNTSSANPAYLIGAAPDIAALYGLPVVWAESFTAESFNSAWRNDPYFLKPWGDIAFCRGINQVYFHGFTHNPFDDRYQPGVSMGFWGTQITRHATWWPYSLPWHTYLARCQYLLRQGRPVNDLLSYPSSIQSVSGPAVNSGVYRQVVLNDESLFSRISVVNGRIVVKGGGEFAALALAPWTAYKPEALRRILELVKEGATLIGGRPPSRSPSLQNYPACDSEVGALVNEIWGNENSANERNLGKGRVINTGDVAGAMDKITSPDVRFTTAKKDTGNRFDFVHRRDGDTDIYFICNSSDNPVDVTADFRVAGKFAEQWDATSGATLAVTNAQQKDGRTLVPVHFEPRQSFFIIFKKAASAQLSTNLTANKRSTVAVLKGGWEVAFDPKWGGPAKIKFDTLQDWSKHPEEGVKYYSGTAVYAKTFDVDAVVLKNKNLYIDLGEVQNIARVNLNGKDLGVIWCAPWHAIIPPGILKSRGNKLTIQVVNTWANRLVGDEQKPDDAELVAWNPPGERKGSYDKSVGSHRLKDLPDWLVRGAERPATGRYTFSTWRFYNKDAPLIPAGLLGPVSIKAAVEK
ncbi:hypothetical protein DJ568_09265 [Mucilaginibacter hurinus]|uniref:Glycosyl hydrolases family 2 sugar binding domain-containing protein n=1 Tax=Mucilaginibacter hurinus TaxID=2201324 RepID=A0A367GPI1_9SPHI|nr:glycosyl hydrolase [Mucilaginibacter hurinus]RCH55359.1 hypothetical protein DJ568_09265 [Mucilaginibacter hurinus]